MAPRRRASTLKDTSEEFVELQAELRSLSKGPDDDASVRWLEDRVQCAHRMRGYLLSDPRGGSQKDAFRHAGGFLVLLDVLQDTLQRYDCQPDSKVHESLLLELFQAAFSILAAAFQSHEGNRRYFREKVHGNGWISLSNNFAHSISSKQNNSDNSARRIIGRIFGCLLACAVDDDSVIEIFVLKSAHEESNAGLIDPSSKAKNDLQTLSSVSAMTTSEDDCNSNEAFVKTLGLSVTVYSAEAIQVMFEVWKILPTDRAYSRIAKGVPKLLNCLTSASIRNLAAIHRTGLLPAVLRYIAETRSLQDGNEDQLHKLASSLLSVGVKNLDDAHFLYRTAKTSPVIADILASSLQLSQVPSYIHFDLSHHGFSSVELRDIGQAFPPMSNSSGYTLSMWFQVYKFDLQSHTTLFGAFDASQSCFVLIYLERDTRNLILQTSIKASRPSVRFKSVSFKESCWYHVALTHRRPKPTSSSRASLFVNGEFVEQVKSQYPALPSKQRSNRTSEGNFQSPVQAFFGTPQDLASRLGRNLIFTQWRLASAQLFSEVLSDDLLAVYYHLGARYTGNFQDCLGSFQTYEASARLNIRNESLHPGKEERSEIVMAIRSKAGNLLPENKILLNISAMNTYCDKGVSSLNDSHFFQSLSKIASRNFYTATRGGRDTLAMNGSYPAINQALLHSSGYGILTGDPTIIAMDQLDDTSWQIGGCAAVCLALINAAEDVNSFYQSIRIFFSTIQYNWRNSEAVERENAFGILANILPAKLARFEALYDPQHSDPSLDAEVPCIRPSLTILKLLLEFTGYRAEEPVESVINNPLAYRVLIVDLDIWRHCSTEVQKLYYEQFVTFTLHSKYQHFNTKRLSRMRIAKKWIEAIKSQSFTSTTFSYFVDSFKVILNKNFSADMMRSLALFITYALYKPKTSLSEMFRRKSTRFRTNSVSSRKNGSSTAPSNVKSPDIGECEELGLYQVALGILGLYTELLCQTDDHNNVRRFARTVTNKWLLFLLDETRIPTVVYATQILGRLLVLSGSNYMEKFVEKTGGITIMRHRLQRLWNVPTIWLVCFAILFGKDLRKVNFETKFDLFSLLETFSVDGSVTIVFPQILPVVTAMLRKGLLAIDQEQPESASPSPKTYRGEAVTEIASESACTKQCSISSTMTGQIFENPPSETPDAATIMHTVVRFLADMHLRSQAFRDFSSSSTYVQDLFLVLFPILVSSSPVSAETELQSRDSTLTFKGEDVTMKPVSASSVNSVPVVRSGVPNNRQDSNTLKPQAPKRMSSYVLVSSNTAKPGPLSAKLQPIVSPRKNKLVLNANNSIIEGILELALAVFCDQIFARKDFPGLGLFMRVPPGFQEHQAYFETFILRNALSHISNNIKLDRKVLCEPRVLTNLARIATHLAEATYEGWFIDGADDALDFIANILEYLQLPDVCAMKSVRLCSQIITNIRSTLFRIVLLKLSDLDESKSSESLISFLKKLAYWQTALLTAQEPGEEYLRLFCYLLYAKLGSPEVRVRFSAADLWRLLLVHNQNGIFSILMQASEGKGESLVKGLEKIMELDNEVFLTWIDGKRSELDKLLFVPLSRSWMTFVENENHRTEETAKARISKRRERLKIWAADENRDEQIIHRHETSSEHWRSNIYTAEHLKWQRAVQDEQDNKMFNHASWSKMSQGLSRACGLFDDEQSPKWQLDQTEGRNRMRIRLVPDRLGTQHDYQPKRRQSQGPTRHRSSVSSSKTLASGSPSLASRSRVTKSPTPVRENRDLSSKNIVQHAAEDSSEDGYEEFELVNDPTAEAEEYEDKNRKVMRSLQRGDQVENVYNVSRIIGLEAVEGLLIMGKGYLYILDHLFQRLDGEIVNATQAPSNERDPYLQTISGRQENPRTAHASLTDFETRSWRWDDVLSISKRRFLFRDVAIEVFFVDGRSYLLTTRDPVTRDDIHQKLLNKASTTPDSTASVNREDGWRIDSLRNPDEVALSLGSRFTNVFTQQASNPATRKWLKGEVSNFHYLMLINTIAGRTFNDLTQYPVFPWVLADYTSEELDLSNPRSFRDLTKPMGCQTPQRQAEFEDRFHSFAEMGDESAPAFHYGTHYSSAMIVTSYLIRLQPFVHSYLLLQGGFFDHADRLFYSVERAWSSAARDTMTDVRELIPEFYYLPEMFTNMNGYDFGERQSSGGTIDNVLLPPWAKGDPKIFVAKHRAALESEHVTRNLHSWIDLVFGHKQRGEAALEATNVFHHLSYHGAKDLDTIDDPVERLATIGIIHNFGQTPHQVFQRSHPAHEVVGSNLKRLDHAAKNLTRLPFPVLESQDRIASLQWSTKQEKLLVSGPLKIHIGPTYDKYVEWGFFDGSVRFFMAESKKLIGLFEHVHIGQLSAASLADSKTLITAGSDCTVSVWTIVSASKSVDLQPRKTFFGHRTSVLTIAVSRSFSALLSASIDGQVILWDLNRLELVRVLAGGKHVNCARINDVTGDIILCRAYEISLWTLNGQMILQQAINMENDDVISACAFYEGNGNEYLQRQLIFTGHKRGVVNIWSIAIKGGSFMLDHVKQMHHMDQAGFNIGASVTAILPMAQVVYIGDDEGRVYEWDCIQRQ